jgi:SNF2 family DNA or RNA helicase
MKEIAYVIDKDLSIKSSQLVIKIHLKNGFDLIADDKSAHYFRPELEKLLTSLDKLALNHLIQEEINFQKKTTNKIIREDAVSLKCLHISPIQSIQALKLMAATGKLYFNGKTLAADFYGKTDFSYVIEPDNTGKLCVFGKIEWKNGECFVQDCDLTLPGNPHFMIKGIFLRLINSTVTWRELTRLLSGKDYTREDIKELQEAHEIDAEEPKVVFITQAKIFQDVSQDPTPYLVLKDKTGAFADLWMDFGEGKKYPFHDKTRSQSQAEKAFEKDLFETDFISKLMVNSHYYCPLDKVAKSLTFLLEIGWKIFDFTGKQLVRYTESDIFLSSNNETIIASGTVSYESHKVNLTDLKGAFNRRDRFVHISENTVGLIPDNFENKGLESLLEYSEIVNDSVNIKRQNIGSLSELLNDKRTTLNDQLAEIKEKLLGFNGVTLSIIPDTFKGVLRLYQQEGVNFLKFLYDFHFHGMLADDMGLGKTVQVLAFLSLLKLQKPVLIVLPASLVFNWELEIKHFTPHFNIIVHHGTKRASTIPHNANIILTTYSTLRLDIEIFKKLTYECLILDEAQTIKNANTQIAQSLMCLNARFRLSITGTPIENHLKELWSHFRFLMPELLGDEATFLADLTASTSDVRYLQKIKKKIRPFILRRKKEDVAKDLPEKIEQTVYVEMPSSQRKVYDDYLSGIKNSLIKKVEMEGVSKHRMEILEAILRLRQICCHPALVTAASENVCLESGKLELLMEDIQTAISEGRKILVYSQFTSMLKLIAKNLKEKDVSYVYLDGQTKDREKVVSAFQNDSTIALFLISLKAGGVGLNLTAADYVLLYDPWWNEAIENQAINRAHRIGRKNTVFAKRYIMRETIEEKMMTLKQNKQKRVSEILDDDLAIVNFTEEDFKFLLS